MSQGVIVTNSTGEIKSLARSALNGAWVKVAICVFIVQLVASYLPGLIGRIIPGFTIEYDIDYLGVKETMQFTFLPLITMVLFNGAFNFATSGIYLRLIRERKTEITSVFSGFKHYVKTLLTNLFTIFLVLIFVLPILILTVAVTALLTNLGGFFAALASLVMSVGMIGSLVVFLCIYIMISPTFYVLYDNPELSPPRAVKSTIDLMRKNVGKLLILRLSYLIWMIGALFLSNTLANMLSAYAQGNWVMIYLINIVVNIPVILATVYMNMGDAFFYEFARGHIKRVADGRTPAYL